MVPSLVPSIHPCYDLQFSIEAVSGFGMLDQGRGTPRRHAKLLHWAGCGYRRVRSEQGNKTISFWAEIFSNSQFLWVCTLSTLNYLTSGTDVSKKHFQLFPIFSVYISTIIIIIYSSIVNGKAIYQCILVSIPSKNLFQSFGLQSTLRTKAHRF